MLRALLPLLALVVPAPLAAAQCPSPSGAFGVGGPGDSVHDLVTADLGGGPAIYVAGRFGAAGDVASSGVARWDGASWSALGSGVDVDSGTVWRVAAVDWGGPRIAALGEFESVGGAPAAGVALWDGTQWDVLGGRAADGRRRRALRRSRLRRGRRPRAVRRGAACGPELVR